MRNFTKTRPRYKFRGFRPWEAHNPLGRWPRADEGSGDPGDSEPGKGQEGEEEGETLTPDEDGEFEPDEGEDEQDSEEPGEDDEGDSDGVPELDPEAEDEVEVAPPEFALPTLPARVGIQIPFCVVRPDLIVREFPSWYDYVKTVADTSLRAWSGKYLASRKPGGGNEWTGTKSFDEAVSMALGRGWPEGRKLLTDAMTLVAPRPEPYKSQIYDVAGAYPMVPLYIAGDPSCMVDPGDEVVTARPVIRIDYSNAGNAHLDPMSLMLRGAALLSCARDLESRGFSTELRVVIYHRNFFGSKSIYYSFIFKKAGQFLDLDRAAFAIAHPSTLRRFGFALIEQHADLEATFIPGYGSIADFQLDPKSNAQRNVIYVPGPKGTETPETARRSVGKIFSDYLSRSTSKKAA